MPSQNNAKCRTFVCVCGSKCNSSPAKSRHIKKCNHFAKAREFINTSYPELSLNKLIQPNIIEPIINVVNNDPLEASYIKMGRAVVKLIQELPITSPLRRPMVAKICKTVRPKDAVIILNFDESTIRKAKKESDDFVLMMKSKPNSTREKISATDIDRIQKYWYDSCRVSSTDVLQAKRKSATSEAVIVSKYWQDSPTCWIFQQYVDFSEHNQIPYHSIGTFVKYKPNNIRPSKKLEGICPICKDFKNNKAKYEEADQLLKHFKQEPECDCNHCQHYSENSQVELIALQRKYEKHLLHAQLIVDKSKYWEKAKQELKEDELIVVMDFASGWEVIDKAVETTNEFFEKHYIKDMIVVVVRKLGGEFHYTYFDLINDNHTSDHHYVREAWDYLLSSEEIFTNKSKIFLFSDGGPAHYKMCKTVVMIGEMTRKYDINIEYNFYPSHHGKGLCDAHIGVGKKYIKNKVKSREVEVESIDDIEMLLKQLKGTKVIRLDNIKTFEDYNVENIDKVRSFHQYTYEFDSENNMSLLCKISYEEESSVIKNVNLITNSGGKLTPNHCLFCNKTGHNHRLCKLLDEQYKKEDFDPSDHQFLSREDEYLPDGEESESDELLYDSDSDYDSISESESELDNVSTSSNEQLTVGKRAGRGNKLNAIISSLM
ncbi:predicted protein [Naegleria gruberi]|uniref:Predicted protein n=1 Tax=Naegleria gruberi TaxID=5762 RepID=D2W5B7_NAEGR|nr:uncharacterized protein NAEGRDRAFT_54775 [Naegleria gruberi]EFC35734.1 predicted protein [Naegleria gruberi]|eukprot:XP_002668478.1 predicted protein [Naegleria gruberi strain NEG-M]